MSPARSWSLLDLLKSGPHPTARDLLSSLPAWPGLASYVEREQARLEAMNLRDRLGAAPGGSLVAGADEVGRGPMAGPLVAAAVALAKVPWIPGLRDSKKLQPEEREAMVPWILAQAQATAICVVPVEELNAGGTIHSHSLAAMRRCVARLAPLPDRLLVDGKFPLPDLSLPQEAVIGGDDRCLSVAAASVLAKVHRDRLMAELDAAFPGYGFARHKGYCTAEHAEALERLGPCPLHRTRFGRVQARTAARVQGTLWDP